MDIQAWKEDGQYLKYKEKYSVFYKIQGQGPVLVLLHGFPTASWDWYKIWDNLSKQFTLIALDFIGFGYSSKPKNYTYSIIDQANIVESILAKQHIESYHLLVHDYGNTVAQELLARHLEKQSNTTGIQSICFLNGGLFPEVHHPRPIQKALISPIGILLTPFLSKAMLRKNFHQIFGPETPPSAYEVDQFYALMSLNGGKYVFHKLIRYMSERKKYRDRWVNALINTQVPMRLIDGALDPVSGRHLAIHYQKTVPNADVILLETIGHYPQTEAPTEVLKHFWDFHRISL